MTEEMIAAIAEAVRHEYQGRSPSRSVARVALTALEAAGLRVFRPDDCDTLTRCVAHDHDGPVNWKLSECDVRMMALVPVEETTEPLQSNV